MATQICLLSVINQKIVWYIKLILRGGIFISDFWFNGLTEEKGPEL